ncbi:hypothetical protein KCP76_14025 [Salmonella enterica subsp. enterica serovar Weltevreden]|nr:hypothetical protein KCP76_14025 [Salmonella enterica subsp. enterica serovar Weltevreden]
MMIIRCMGPRGWANPERRVRTSGRRLPDDWAVRGAVKPRHETARRAAIPFWKTAALPPVCWLRCTELRVGSEVIHDREEQVARIGRRV